MEQTAVEYLIKEFSNILGKIQTEPLQDLFLIDAINKSKEMEKQQIINAFYKGIQEQTARVLINAEKTTPEQYYEQRFNK